MMNNNFSVLSSKLNAMTKTTLSVLLLKSFVQPKELTDVRSSGIDTIQGPSQKLIQHRLGIGWRAAHTLCARVNTVSQHSHFSSLKKGKSSSNLCLIDDNFGSCFRATQCGRPLPTLTQSNFCMTP